MISVEYIKLLTIFIQDPKSSFRYEDLSPKLPEISESSIRRMLQELEKRDILNASYLPGRPRGGKRVKNYRLNLELSHFDKIFQIFLKDGAAELLASPYIDHIVKNYHLARVYEIIKHELENVSFNQRASKALLKQSSVMEEYRETAKFISDFLLRYYTVNLFDFYKLGVDLKDEIRPNSKDYAEIYGLLVDRAKVASPLDLGYRRELSSLQSDDKIEQIKSKIGYKLRPLSGKHIEFLTTFDKLESVRLYRNVVYREIVKLFGKLSKIPSLGPKSLFQFMEYDNYLSPFTSYPVQSLEIPLFSRPFQRIYDDAYLLGQDNLKILADRAFVIYNNFASVLSEFFKFSAPRDKKALRRELMEFIYLWNISSTNFDLIWIYINNIYKEPIGSGNYYIQSDGIRFYLSDLETNKPLPDEKRYIKTFSPKPMLFEKRYEARRSMERPFTHLRPCLCFQDLFEWSEIISIDQILSELKPSYDKYDSR